ncbi:MAG: RloB domain-containing protein, partial [Chloroflexi bacterium]|nr:RloB domain-containing protein [Chloroflexota bacterium]
NVIDVYGLGDNTVGLVERALELRRDEDYDQVWCVFDRNSFPAERFNAALALAEKEGLRVAYSNEAFEIWYLLHFNYYDTAMSRNDYIKKLNEHLGHRYEKNSETIYGELGNRQPEAMRNARRLLEQYSPPRPVKDNPSTTVHLLVKQLNRFVR